MALSPSDNWSFYKQIDVTDGDNVSADFQMKLYLFSGDGSDSTTKGHIYCNCSCSTWPNDIRFGTTSEPSEATQLNMWEFSSNAASSQVWIKLPDDGSNTFYIFMGRADTSSASTGYGTFIAFDDEDWSTRWSEEGDPYDQGELSGSNERIRTHYSAAKHTVYKGGGDEDSSRWYFDTTELTTQTSIDFYINRAQTDSRLIINGNTDASTDISKNSFFFQFDDDGTIQWYSGTTLWTGSEPYIANKWYKLTIYNINYSDSTYDIHLDDNEIYSDCVFRSGAISSNYLVFNNLYDEDGINYYDAITIRKAADTPPTWNTFGSWTAVGAAPPPSSPAGLKFTGSGKLTFSGGNTDLLFTS